MDRSQARNSFYSKTIEYTTFTRKKKALKKLAPAPGWKPYGTPTKRRLDGKDW